jgi:hypothetical protein
MRFRLGQFPLQDGRFSAGLVLESRIIRHLEELVADARRAGSALPPDAPARLESMLEEARARADAKKKTPDLLASLERDDPDRGWIREVHEEMLRAKTTRESLCLVACERDDGGAAIAAFDRARSFAVGARDVVSAGFAAVRNDARMAVYPRFVRQLCVNGQVIILASNANILEECGSVGEAVARCLSGDFLARARERVRIAAETRVASAAGLLDEPELWPSRERILANYHREGDWSAWGLWNAVTAHARGIPQFRRRLRLELEGAWLLQRIGEARAFAPRTE